MTDLTSNGRRMEPPRFPELLASFITCFALGTLAAGGMVVGLALF